MSAEDLTPKPPEHPTPQPEAPENPWDIPAAPTEGVPAAPAGKPLTLLPSTLLVLLTQLITSVVAVLVVLTAILGGAALIQGNAPWQLLVLLAATVLPGISALGAIINSKLISAFGYQQRSFWQILTAYLLGWLGSMILSGLVFVLSSMLIFLAGAGEDGSSAGAAVAIAGGVLYLLSLVGTLLLYGWLVTVEWGRGLARTLGTIGLVSGFLLVLTLGMTVGSLIDSGIGSVKDKLEKNIGQDTLPGQSDTLRDQLKDQDLLGGQGEQNDALPPAEEEQLKQQVEQQLEQMLQGK